MCGFGQEKTGIICQSELGSPKSEETETSGTRKGEGRNMRCQSGAAMERKANVTMRVINRKRGASIKNAWVG